MTQRQTQKPFRRPVPLTDPPLAEKRKTTRRCGPSLMPPSRQPQGRELPSVAVWIYSVYQTPLDFERSARLAPARGTVDGFHVPATDVSSTTRGGVGPLPRRAPPPWPLHTAATPATGTARRGHPRCGHTRRSRPLYHHLPPLKATTTPPHSGEARVTTLGWASRVSATKTDSLLWQPEREWRVAVAAIVRVVGRSACAGNPEQSSIYDH